MAAVTPLHTHDEDDTTVEMNGLRQLKPRRIAWDVAYLDDLDPDELYLYLTFEPSESQLSRADFLGLISIQVGGVFWLKPRLIKLMRTREKNYVLIFTSQEHPTRLNVDIFTLEREPVKFHFFDLHTQERKEIECKP